MKPDKTFWLNWIINQAQYKSLSLRRPWNVPKKDHGPAVALAIEQLDLLGVPWSIQNKYLNLINNADQQDTHEYMLKNSLDIIHKDLGGDY